MNTRKIMIIRQTMKCLTATIVEYREEEQRKGEESFNRIAVSLIDTMSPFTVISQESFLDTIQHTITITTALVSSGINSEASILAVSW